MFKAEFVGRSRELETLDGLWNSNRATLLVLSGRRRVGKTRLLTHWLQKHPEDGLYWVAEPGSELTQLRSFSQAFEAFIDPEMPVPSDFTYATWEQAFRQVSRYAKSRRIAVFIDEFTYLIDVNPDIVGTLQKSWDHSLSNSNLMLSLSGSQMGLMQRHLLDIQAPLYGRATSQMQLPALPFGATSEYFPEYGIIDRVRLFAMWGGVPAYWERLNPELSVVENLRRNILPSHAWMMDESRILLQDFIKDLHNYVGILRAIADGEQAMGEIAKRTGLATSKASFYLNTLQKTGFVERQVPITQRNTNSRRGRYVVTDPYLRFFYRFLAAYQSKLALGQIDQMFDLIQNELPEFIRNNTWRELCQEWVLRASADNQFPVDIEAVGSEWSKNLEIDVVGINEISKTLILGDCHWTDEPVGVEAVKALVQKTALIVPKKEQEEWTVFYTCFSANGWTDEAKKQANGIAEKGGGRRRPNWNTAGIRLVNLNDVDEDLVRLSL